MRPKNQPQKSGQRLSPARNDLGAEREFEFTLVLTGFDRETPGADKALFEAGCDDTTLAFPNGQPFLVFCRAAGSLRDAIVSAIDAVEAAQIGATVLRLESCAK